MILYHRSDDTQPFCSESELFWITVLKTMILYRRSDDTQPFLMSFSRKRAFRKSLKKVCGESRIRTCEVLTADLQSALVGRLSISPNHISIKKEPAEGLEPTTCWLQISCSSQLSYAGNINKKSPLFLTDCKCISFCYLIKTFFKKIILYMSSYFFFSFNQ